ncbi:enoyl-CoA hydratase domain-containing protein 3 [Huso huso]|uniref:Enoyl-CoA hydratase domain-containing protein 3, mitochondrial n=1 Tax=Huso huso TaxID=61971 RepID=A0ABR0ZD58_HUSHU
MASPAVASKFCLFRKVLLFSRLATKTCVYDAGMKRSLATHVQPEKLTVRVQQNGIRNIILNNPKKRNALSLSMLNSLQTDIRHEIEREDLRVIIISAEGPVFSSGHDLKELTSAQGREHHSKVFEACAQVMTLIQDIPVPVIAKVNGMATAAGCQLVASCDIAVASEKSMFATPGVNIGLFCSTPAVAIGRAVPRKVALEMLFTGAPISAQDALLHGLVSKVVLEEKLEEETLKIAQKICDTSRPVVSLGKAMFYRQMAQGRNTAYRMASQAMVDNLALKDGQEGIKSFIEKRQPVWTHTTDKAHK